MARLGAATVGIVGILFCLFGCPEGKNLFDLRLVDLLRKPTEILDVARFRRIAGGTTVSACDFPGVVAVTFNLRIMCGGIHKAGKVIIPNDCAEFLDFVTRLGSVVVYGDDGTVTGEIDTVVATNNNDGTSTIPLTSAFGASKCGSSDYIPYDPAMTVDTSSCQIVSYGGLTKKGHAFDGNLQSAPLVANPLQGYCAGVIPNLEYYAVYGTVDRANMGTYTCAKTAQGLCNGDTGAPVYCTDTGSGQNVVVGMVATAKCSSAGELFVAVDMTAGSLAGFSS